MNLRAKMLSKAAEQCTEYLIKYNKITEQQKSIYKYGFELLVSTAVCIGAILVCGILGGYGKEAIIFLLSFIPIRITAGGYHAGSYGRCDRPLNQAVILADGSMVLCRRDWNREAIIGNVKESSIEQLWKSSKMMEYQKKIIENNYRNQIVF